MPGVTVSDAEPVPVGSLRAGRRRFSAVPDRMLVPGIVLAVAALAAQIVVQTLDGDLLASTQACVRTYAGLPVVTTCGPTLVRGQLAFVVGLFLFLLLGQLWVAGMNRACLDVVDDVPVRSPFAGWSLIRVLPTAAVVSAAITVGLFLCVLPGVLIAFATMYATTSAVDRGTGALASIKVSVDLVLGDLRRESGFALRSTGLLLVGLLCLVVGLFAAIPVVLLAQAERYRARVPG
ncbi:MAG: hypothetical protein JWR52_1806 [Marmoricola sp.]|nr:hypothetical protein [Marmoricola sp.]